MLTLTEPAAQKLAQMLSNKKDTAVVRIVRRNARLRMRMDRLRPDDRTFFYGGRVVLALDEAVSSALATRKLDVRQTATGPRLRLKLS